MTAYNLYCDESRHTSDPSQAYTVIGVLQCPRADKQRIVHRIHSLMALHNAQGEFGWKRLSPNRRDFYWVLMELFIQEPELRFRCVVADKTQFDHERFNEGDAELGFYKLYYQALVHWLQPKEQYHLYLDWQQNASSNRFKELRSVLVNKLSGRAKVACLEPVCSKTQPLIQLADLLMGAVGYDWNQLGQRPNASECKRAFVAELAEHLGRKRLNFATGPGERKFNIFNWQGRV